MRVKEFFRKVGDHHRSPRFRSHLSAFAAVCAVIHVWTMTVSFPIWYITKEVPEGLEALALASMITALFSFLSWLVCTICYKVRKYKEWRDYLNGL